MNPYQRTTALNRERLRTWNEAKNFLDDCQRRHPNSPMTGEERRTWDAMNVRLDQLDTEVHSLNDRENRERESGVAREAFERQVGSDQAGSADTYEAADVRRFLRGEERRNEDWEAGHRNAIAIDLAAAQRESAAIRAGADAREVRALMWDTGSSGSLVPTTLSRTLYQYLEASIAPFRMPTTKVTTAGGEPLQFPRVGAHAIATQVIAQGTAIGGTDPTFLRTQLDAFKYGELVQIANEVVQDSGIDIVSFVARDVGRAVGRKVGTDLMIGTGSGQPQGMMTAATTGAAGTIATGGTLITPTYENLVDLAYSVNDTYRSEGNAAFLMKDSTAGNLRKLRDGAGGTIGAVLWQPSLTNGLMDGEPDRLMGWPCFTDPNVSALGSANRIIGFGDWSSYFVRQVGNFVLERSDEYAFNTDLATFRGKWRVDGDYMDLNATNVLRQSVT